MADMKLRHKLGRWIAGQKGVSFEGDVVAVLQGRGAPKNFTHGRAASHVGKQAVVAACISAWLREYPQAPFQVKDAKGQPDYKHPLLQVLKRPNEWMSGTEFKTLTAYYKLLTGTTYVHIVRNNRKVPIKLDLYHRLQVTPKSTKEHAIDHYIIRDGVSQWRAETTDMIRLPWFVRDPGDILNGISPLQSAFTELESYTELTEFVYEFLQNGAVPGSIVTAPNGLAGSDEEQEQQKKDFRERFGKGNRGQTLFATGDLRVQTFAHGLKDLDISALREGPEASVCAAFGVPAEYVAVLAGLRNANYSNKAEARRAFAQHTLAAAWTTDAEIIGDHLLREFGDPEYTLQFDTSELPALMEDADKRSERVSAQFGANIITRDEARASLGYDPVDNAQVFAVSLTKPEAIQKSAKAWGDDTKEEAAIAASWKAAADRVSEAATPFEEELTKAFEALHAELRKEVERAKAFGGAYLKREPRTIGIDRLRKLFLEGTKASREDMVKELVDEAVRTGESTADEVRSWVAKVMKDVFGISTEKMEQSIGTINDELKEAFGTSDPDELAKNVDAVIAAHLVRISMITQTTATASNTKAQDRTWDELNKRRKDRVITKRWLTERDSKVRDTHRAVDGAKADVGGFFSVGRDRMTGPGTGSVAEENIRCRCVLVPVVEKIKE